MYGLNRRFTIHETVGLSAEAQTQNINSKQDHCGTCVFFSDLHASSETRVGKPECDNSLHISFPLQAMCRDGRARNSTVTLKCRTCAAVANHAL